MNVTFNKVVARDEMTPAQRFASMVKDPNTFYAVGEELYLGSILLSATDAAEISVADAGGNYDGTNVEAVLAELATMVGDQDITVTKSTGGSSDDYAYRYVFSQGGTPITNGTIDIMKDMVATEGQIVYPTAQDPIIVDGQQVTSGTFIELIIANGDPFYINVADLIEFNQFTDSDEIDFTDTDHNVTASIKKIAGTKIIYRAADATQGITELNINDKVDAVEGKVDNLTNYVGEIPSGSSASTVVGYIDEKTGDGIDALDSTADIASVANGIVTIKGGLVETDGIVENAPTSGTGAKADVVLAKVATTGAAVDVSVADAGSHFTGSTVEAALQELGAQLVWTEV